MRDLKTLAALRRRYSGSNRHGVGMLRRGESLTKFISAQGIPDGHGVYSFSTVKGRHVQLAYLGKSGTFRQDGTVRSQMLRARLANKQDGMSRAKFLSKKLRTLDAIQIEWFVTYQDSGTDFPFVLEAAALAEYLSRFKHLPPWNRHA